MPEEKPPLPDWLRPLWVRIAFVVLPAAWAAFEFANGQAVWGLLFGAAAAWGAYTLLYQQQPPTGR
jgi:hypothetical protein